MFREVARFAEAASHSSSLISSVGGDRSFLSCGVKLCPRRTGTGFCDRCGPRAMKSFITIFFKSFHVGEREAPFILGERGIDEEVGAAEGDDPTFG